MSQGKRKILAILLLMLFAFYFANVSFFFHSHTYNGYTISHSHLYGSNHAKTGTHTAAEFSLISVLSNFQSLQAVTCAVGVGLLLVCLAILRMGTECKIVSTLPNTSYLRGPPTCM